MVALDLSDIQGNILHGYNFSAGVYSFVTVPDAESGRKLLHDLLPAVTDASHWQERPTIAVNVAVTHAGLKRLGVDQEILDALPPAFAENMQERAVRVLGDTGCSNPSNWDGDLRDGNPHLLISLAAWGDEPEPLQAASASLSACITGCGGEVVASQRVGALPRAREHFGFADGFGQPAVEGVTGNWAGQGTRQLDTGAWTDIKAGEFILGHPNEDGECLAGPVTWLLRNGSYMVYRKLRQDVKAFRRAVAAAAEGYAEVTNENLCPEAGFERIAAKLVGRWRDGTALELKPTRGGVGNLQLEVAEQLDNDFRYGDDLRGFTCPRGAHIRRANPRDLVGRDQTEARRHRIIRRGMSYGDPYPEETERQETDTRDRGLIFICFNADFERQFELIQAQWCNDGNAFGLGDDRDYLLGSAAETNGRPQTVTIEGEPPFVVPARPDLVATRGCAYLLMPGLQALRYLAGPGRGDGGAVSNG